MIITITEVQITFVILLGLSTLILMYSPKRLTSMGKEYNLSRKLLLIGTLLTTIHFTIQYVIQKNIPDITYQTTLVNLVFGIPVSYFFCLSILNLQRHGGLKRWEWLMAPTLTIIALGIILTFFLIRSWDYKFMNYMIAILYGFEIFVNAYLMLDGHRIIVRSNNPYPDNPNVSLVEWTKWNAFFMVIISLGFPIIIFNTNLLVRSIYGLMAVISAFLYIFSFIGYGVSCNIASNSSKLITENQKEGNNVFQKSTVLNDIKLSQIQTAVQKYIDEGKYLQPEITIKEAADEMHISSYMLRMWLRTTEYEKFSNWITFLRISHAKKLFMESPNRSCEEVAMMCGFCSRQYFQSQFSKYEEITPTKWIKENLLNNNLPTQHL